MKQIILTSIILLLSIFMAIAQAPDMFKYQTVVRNSAGSEIKNQKVALRISILKASANGSLVYSEIHHKTTNDFGLVNLEVGVGSVESGSFSSINWGNDNFFVKIELDAANGSSFVAMGTSQLLSVPYALHAKTVQNYTETDPTFASSPANNISLSSISNWNAAYGWGNPAGLFRPISYVPSWGEITNKPTTLAGYGITDVISGGNNGVTPALIANWNAAFGWGNHAGLYRPISYVPAWSEITAKPTTLIGYGITDAMSTSHAANNVSLTSISNWNTAFGWGNHAGLYRPITYIPSWNEIANKPTTLAGYGITDGGSGTTGGGTSVDPALVANWNAAFGWGNHAGLYRPISYVPAWGEITAKPTTLTGYGITDAMNTTHAANGITPALIANWNSAFGWGNHAGLYRPISYVPSWTDVTNKPAFATVATSGSYADLLNKPNALMVSTTPIAGDIVYYNGTAWQVLPKGINGQTLRIDNGLPKWGEPGYALPMVTTTAVTDILQTGATTGGNIIATGYSDITARGVCWGTAQNPTTADSKTSDGTGIGTFNSKIINLLANTTYYAKAYATNAAGTAYGNQVTFKTVSNVVFPTVTTTAITNITANAVVSGGNVTATGGGEVTARGVCWSANQNPTVVDSKTTDGTGTGQFQSQITGLVPGTYYARAYATNSSGTGYGNMVTFTTEKTLPVLTTKLITDISAMGAVSGGNISSAGGGTISGRGICWSDSPNPTIANEKTISPATASSFSAAIAKATPGTVYYLRAYATNEIGTGYGDQKTFTTSGAQYYTSFESGMTPTGWTGPFTVSNERAFEGSYSFMSLNAVSCDATFTTTLSAEGQLSFYYSFNDGYSIDIYIDDVKITNYPNDGSGWRQGLTSVSSGLHKFRWHFNHNSYWGAGKCYIDQIIITK